MQILDKDLMKQIFPTVSPQKREIFLPFINLAMARFAINTERRVAMFCAQVAHESNNLSRWVENLNYSAKRLTQVFPRRFPTIASTNGFVGNNRALANKIYGGRMGNRVGTDDGFNYRGRCPMQATGREMYQELTRIFGAEFDVNFVTNPDLLLDAKFGFLASAAIFTEIKGCNPLSDAGQVVAVTKKINGGTNGLAERKANYERNLRFLPDGFRLMSYDAMKTQFAGAPSRDERPLIQNSSFDFDNHFDAVKDEADAIESEKEFGKTAGDGVIDPNAPEPSDTSDTSDKSGGQTSGDSSTGGTVNQKADVIANMGGAADASQSNAAIEAAAALPDTHVKETEKTGFGAKVLGILSMIFTGQYIVPQFVADGVAQPTFWQVVGHFFEAIGRGLWAMRYFIFASLALWYVVRKAESLFIRNKQINVNTDPTKGNVVLAAPPPSVGWFQSFRNKIGI